MIDISPILQQVTVSIKLEKGMFISKILRKAFPDIFSSSLINIAQKTKEKVSEQFEATRRHPHDPKTPSIMDQIKISQSIVGDNEVSIKMGSVYDLETKTPWYKYQEEGVRPYTYSRTYRTKSGETVVREISHPGFPARHFISAGFNYMETEGKKDLEEFLHKKIQEVMEVNK